jgi:hypothetical protein
VQIRWLLLLGLAMFPACASSLPRSTASTVTPGQSAPTVSTAQPTAPAVPIVTAPTEGFLSAAGPPCSVLDLTLRLGVQGGAGGNGVALLVVTDKGDGPCTLRGTPSVSFLDSSGRMLATPSVDHQPSGYFPATPNSGVGLLPLSDPGMSGSAGIRGQAALPLQYSDNECATSVARAQIVLPSGSLSAAFQLFGSAFPGCQPPSVSVNPFQPAEAAA